MGFGLIEKERDEGMRGIKVFHFSSFFLFLFLREREGGGGERRGWSGQGLEFVKERYKVYFWG